MAAHMRRTLTAHQRGTAWSPQPAFAKRRYVAPLVALGLSLAAMLVVPKLFIRHREVQQGSSTVVEQTGTMQINEPPAGVVDLEAPAVLVFDLPLSLPGEYAFVVSVDGTEAARVAFQARAIGTAGGPVH